uniref:G-protein coupled receptors family 1 profile domain-containing protein n=1 Tax=Glossina palpalis gambiensis TaxID=67801 RepID=A0A1B0AZD6_9MUSC
MNSSNKFNVSNKERKDFLTECLFPSPTRPYELPWEQKTMWAIVFGIMLLVAITGNCIVLWIVTVKDVNDPVKLEYNSFI